MSEHVIVVGGGIFGITGALALAQRGASVILADSGPIPHPLAASTDVSKVIRADYGDDELYTDLMREAFVGWDRWNASITPAPYHETGFLLLSEGPMTDGTFERASYERAPGAQRVDPDVLRRRFPSWNADRYADGYLSPRAGWAESGRVVEVLAAEARASGVDVRQHVPIRALSESGGNVTGVVLADGTVWDADVVVVAAGTWTWTLVPELADRLVSVGQPVIHFKPADRRPFQADVFPVWAADISRTGWYGFPALPDGRVKVANHGPGRVIHPDAPRAIVPDDEARFRAFLRDAIPGLADAPVAYTRLCMYSDTFDGDFLIARHPTREGLVVASGGSGHAFKFAPVLGDLIADVVKGVRNPWTHRFRWREKSERRYEAARGAPR